MHAFNDDGDDPVNSVSNDPTVGRISRRSFLGTTLLATSLTPAWSHCNEKPALENLEAEVGITTGSFMRHLASEPRQGKLRLLDLPKLMRDELDMRVIDLMTRTLASMEPKYLEELRSRAEKAGCVITNLKMNQRGLEMASPDQVIRDRALAEYKRTIDAAHRLGCRWVRPLPGSKRPDMERLAASYRTLIYYAAPKGISLLIENFAWLQDDPLAIPAVIGAVGEGLTASPDTGNWTDRARYEGLAKAFPHAVTCDFKAYMFDPEGKHPRYDLKRCFQVAWNAGFRGPWCLEHFDETLKGQLAGMKRLRDMLKTWTQEAA